MSALFALTRWQARLQWRYGVIAAAISVLIPWAAVLWPMPDAAMPRLLPAILLGDTAIFGFFLLTGMLFLEHDDNVLDALRVVPIGPGRDLVARIVPFTLVSVVIGAGITLAAHGAHFNWLALVLGIGFAAPMHMLAGVAYAARFRKITDYFFPAALLLIPAGIPLLHFYGVWQPALMWAMPTMPPLTLFRGMFETLSTIEWAYGILGSALWTGLAFMWAKGEIHRFARRRAKGGRIEGRAGIETAAPTAPNAGVEAKAGIAPTTGVESTTGVEAIAPTAEIAPTAAVEATAGVESASPIAPTTATARRFHGVGALALVDFRNIAREPLMAFIAVYAITLAFIVRWLLPILQRVLEGTLDLTPYHPLIAGSFALAATPIMLGAVVGLLLLDERDEGSLAALRVTPLPAANYAAYRAAFPTIVSALFTFFVIWIVGLVVPPNIDLLPVAILSAIEAPIAMLVLAAFAGNKVEGLALMKGLGFFLLGPIAAWFVAPPWRWLFGIMPTYWPNEAFWRISGATGVGGEPGASAWPVLIIGFAYHALLLWWLARRFVRRI